MGFLKGKTAIITGGGRAVFSDGSCDSIGYGIATAYAKEGANLVITGRNLQKLEDAKEELERLYGIQVLPVQADVNAGAEVIAGDNIIVQGNLRGLAHAGAKGNKDAIITAGNLEALQVRISNIVKEIDKTDNFNVARAYICVKNDKIEIEKW